MGKIANIINNAIDREIQDFQPRLYRASGLAMRDVRNEIIEKWFGGFDSASMIGAFVYPKAHGRISRKGGTITVETYAKVQMYNPNQEIQNWNQRNGVGMSQYEAMEYVMRLQLGNGIIGLPSSGINSDWVNTHFHQQSRGLYAELSDSANWSNFKNYLLKYL